MRKDIRSLIVPCSALLLCGAAAQAKKPNVLFIITDEQSFNMLSCAGNAYLQTPNMDRLARQGYRFEKSYVANPVSMPSRFAIFTGRSAYEIGARNNNDRIDSSKLARILDHDAVGNLFRKAGYETYYTGKVHMYGTSNTFEEYHDPTPYGFEWGVAPGVKGGARNWHDGPVKYAQNFLSERKDKSDNRFSCVFP